VHFGANRAGNGHKRGGMELDDQRSMGRRGDTGVIEADASAVMSAVGTCEISGNVRVVVPVGGKAEVASLTGLQRRKMTQSDMDRRVKGSTGSLNGPLQ